MAIKPSYPNAKTLKKLTVGGATYFLKDADLRALVETFGNAVYKDVVTTFNPDGVDIATEAATAKYIKEQVSSLSKAMRYMGVVERSAEAPEQTDQEAIAAHYVTLGETPTAGDVVIMKDNTKEYIYSGTEWQEVGDQNMYLTIAKAAATYTPMERTIAGIDLKDNITAEELSAPTALDIKGLAHKDQAAGTVEVAISAQDLSVAKAGDYTVTGETVSVPQSFNALDVTPAGTVEVKAAVAATAEYQKANSATITAVAPGKEEQGNYTPEGSISLPTVTTNVQLTEEAVDTVTDKGTAYTLTDGSVTKAEDVKAKFVKKGMSFTMDDAEETLTLAYVDTSDAEFYTDAVTATGDVSYTKQTLSGALPTFGTKNVAKATGATATTEFGGTATFNGTATKLAASLGYAAEQANVTQPTFTATFSGTSKTVTPEAATTANAQAPDGKVTIGTETKAITLNKETKTVTVQ